MKCSKCNNKIKERQEVCLSCGHILGYESEASKKCIHCNREIPLSYKKCPFCRKKQNKRKWIVLIISLLIIMLINLNLLTILYSSDTIDIKDNYKETCEEILYEDLVRKNIKYDESLVKISGTVKDVEKISKFFNRIKITITIDNNTIFIIYNNKTSVGFINGDKVEIYGKYKDLEGNKPIIHAKYINIKNTEK